MFVFKFCSLIALFVYVRGTQTEKTGSNCEYSRFLHCKRHYATVLNMKFLPANSTAFIQRVESLEKQQLCWAYRSFEHCTGESFQSCANRDTLMRKFQLTENDAENYLDFWARQDRECDEDSIKGMTLSDAERFGSVVSCNQTTFNSCLAQFTGQVELQTMPKNFKAFFVFVLRNVHNSRIFSTYCNYVVTYMRCMGRNEVRKCINAPNLAQMGLTQPQAMGWVAFDSFTFNLCTLNFKRVFHNFGCIRNKTEERAQDSVKFCWRNFTDGFRQDPPNACKYGNDYLHCVSQQYKAGCNLEAASAVCESNRAGLRTALPNCVFNCSVSHELRRKSCPERRFRTCLSSYIRSLADPLLEILQNVDHHVKNRPGVHCNSFRRLQRCMGGRLGLCMSMGHLKRLRMGRSQAASFLAMQKKLYATCKTRKL